MQLPYGLEWIEAGALFMGALFAGLAWRRLCRAAGRFRRARWAREQRTISDLAKLTPNEFERLTAAAFEARGWRVEIVGREGRHDGGLDLLLHKAGRCIVAQCKRYTGKVGAAVIRETIGVMVHHRAQRQSFDAARAALIEKQDAERAAIRRAWQHVPRDRGGDRPHERV